ESRLREKFNIDGAKGDLMQDYKFKSKMKSRFAKANVPAAPWVKSSNKNDITDFAEKQGFPLFCKPDNGVGAEGTHKFGDFEQLMNFLNNNNFGECIFEPFVDGEIYSFDGLCDKDGELVFTAAHRFYTPIDELKQSGCECVYRTLTEIPTTLFEEGSRTAKAFELKNSFFHIEFFKLNKAIDGVANVGDFVALEANMRIAGGYTAEMIYNALGLDIYALWAAVVGGEKPNLNDYTFFPTKRAVVNVSRKNGRTYKFTPQQLKDAFVHEYILGAETAKDENPFGNYEMVAAFTDENRLNEFVEMALEKI
ncbi:MAG: ATP-grasp domain-containing protein, partial [Clostridia bacterium]